jgi:hypothetical protein
MLELPRALWAVRYKYIGYEPQRVTSNNLFAWLDQFERSDRGPLLKLLQHVTYVSEDKLRGALANQSRSLLKILRGEGIAPDHVIFMSVSDAGSSSPFHLSQLRADARLEQQGCPILDARDIRGIASSTSHLGDGAIVYVDDFLGTGNQFLDARDDVAAFVVGTFSEFFVVACALEEGYAAVRHQGIEVMTPLIHERARRPLHPYSSILKEHERDRLLDLSSRLGLGDGLGYQSMASMLVLYRNAPDAVPSLLRGSPGQHPYVGIFPRSNDL